MKVAVRVYYNTGFNMIDRPSSQSVIENSQAEYLDIPNIFVVQNVGLTSITVPMSYEQSRGIDYVRLTAFMGTLEVPEKTYYVLTSYPVMTNEQNCLLQIRQDFVATYGISKSDFISGQINAAHVPNDNWKWSEIEETRFKPSGVLQVATRELNPDTLPNTNNSWDKINIVNTTIDPVRTAVSDNADVKWTSGVGLDDTHEGNIAVAVPLTIANNYSTIYRLFKPTGITSTGQATFSYVDYTSKGYSSYQVSPFSGGQTDPDTSFAFREHNTLNYLRSYGLTDSILASYNIDRMYLQDILTNRVSQQKVINEEPINLSENQIHNIKPINITTDASTIGDIFKYEYTLNGYTPHNKKVFSGDNNKYILVSKCTGNMIEFNPEDIMMLSNNSPTTIKPLFIITADLRVQGAPRIYPVFLNNNVNLQMLGINGMNWQNNQIIYFGQEGSGYANNSYKIKAAELLRQANIDMMNSEAEISGLLGSPSHWAGVVGRGVLLSKAAGTIGVGGVTATVGGSLAGLGISGMVGTRAGAGWGAGDLSGKYAGNMASQLANIGGSLLDPDMTNAIRGMTTANGTYEFNKSKMEYAQLLATANIKSPTVDFPYNESNMDLFGNFFTLFRTTYSLSMLKQLDNFYDKWGYMVGGIEITGETDDWLSNRKYFNYISMTNVSLKKNNLSMLERDGLAADLASVRLWKILPKDWNSSMGNPINNS